MNDLVLAAKTWLAGAYGDTVVLDGTDPVHDGEELAFFGCRHAAGVDPMLAATIGVPRDGGEPFPVANSDPLNERLNLAGGRQDSPWRWRANARNCVVATVAAVDHRPVSALPWKATDEAQGWWEKLLTAHFPEAEVAVCASWPELGDAVVDGGEGARGVVWLRRRLGGRTLTGHLLYAEQHDGRAVFIDGQRGTVAQLHDDEVAGLVLARFRREPAGENRGPLVPWSGPAMSFGAAMKKARAWLAATYDDEVDLVRPDPGDEIERGWLFACNTKSFIDRGDWRDQMLDAAVLVPKADGQFPSCLPNRDPWGWLADWDAGEPVPAPPSPGQASWFGATMAEIGEIGTVRAHSHWAGVLEEISLYPAKTRALVWVRRKDQRDRETVGHVLWAIADTDGIRLIDPTAENEQPLIDPEPMELRVIRMGQAS
jgi:hypothetical protein